MIPVVVVLILALLLVARSMVVVPAGMAFVIDRLGRFDRVLMPGRHFVPPFITIVRARVPLGEQTIDVPATTCVTRDGGSATVRGSVTLRVLDAAVACTSVADYRSAVAQTMARVWCEAVAANDVVSAPAAVRAAHSAVDSVVAAWGIKVLGAQPLIELDDRAMRQLEGQAGEARDARVAAWARGRGQTVAPDGRPTEAQCAAYDEWIALEVRANQRETEAARRASQEVAPASPARAAAALQFGVARGTIAPGELGVVEAGGREWAARNVSSTAIASGFRCAVERQEGDTLFVRAM